MTQYFTQVNTYYVIEEVLPQLLGDPATLDKIYIRSPTSNQMVPVSAFAKWTTAPVAPLSISHQGQFPAITVSFNLAQGVALGPATAAVQRAMQELQLPQGLTTTFQGNAQAFQDSLTSVPLLILAALVCVYLILGNLAVDQHGAKAEWCMSVSPLLRLLERFPSNWAAARPPLPFRSRRRLPSWLAAFTGPKARPSNLRQPRPIVAHDRPHRRHQPN